MMTINIPDVTICMHLRIDSMTRLKNVITILKFLLAKKTNAKIIVMEVDAIQRGMILNELEGISYVFVQDDNPVFHFTRYRNELIRMASTPIVALWDVDIIVPLNQLFEAIEKVRNREAVLAWPYDGICLVIPKEISELVRATVDIEVLDSRKKDFFPLFGGLNTGGVFLANREKYMEIGMDNENFCGWGPEDTERLKRVTILDLPVWRVRGDLYHLWHPRGKNSGYNDPQRQMASINEFLKICQCSREELLSYIRTWKWINNENKIYEAS